MLDAFHLKGPWNGVCLIATCCDADNKTILLSFCVCPIENKDNYVYMLQSMKKCEAMRHYMDDIELVVVSDRDKGLLPAVAQELPNAIHRTCLKHLLRNAPPVGVAAKSISLAANKISSHAAFALSVVACRPVYRVAFGSPRSFDLHSRSQWSTLLQ